MRRILVALTAVVSLACGGSSPSAPAPTPTTPNVAGSWSGTLTGSMGSLNVTAQLAQDGSSVSGTWVIAGSDTTGAINGAFARTEFSGSFTVNAPDSTGTRRCDGLAAVSGSVPVNSSTLVLTSPAGFSGNCDGLPANLRWSLQRQ